MILKITANHSNTASLQLLLKETTWCQCSIQTQYAGEKTRKQSQSELGWHKLK